MLRRLWRSRAGRCPRSAQYGTPEEWRRSDADDRRIAIRASRRRPRPRWTRPIAASRCSTAPSEAPGTIIIDTSDRFLYLIQPNNVALRYGIGVGRDGFQWQGLLRITRKRNGRTGRRRRR